MAPRRILPVGGSKLLRVQDGPLHVIETGMIRPAGASQNAATGSDDAYAVRWKAPRSGTLTSVFPYFFASSSTPQYDLHMFPESSNLPVGAKYGDALGSITAVTANNGTMGAEAAFTTPVANIVQDSYYWFLFVWRQGSFQLGYNPGMAHPGERCLFTLGVADPVQSSIWTYRQNISIPMRMNWADGGQTTNILGTGSVTSGNLQLHGDPASASAGRHSGFRFQPDRDWGLEFLDISYRVVYAVEASANAIEARVYQWGSWGAPIRVSDNTIPSTEAGASNSNRLGTFLWGDRVKLAGGGDYLIDVCQSGVGGSSDSSNYFVLDGSSTTNYTDHEPEACSDNLQRLISVSSITGVEDVALNTTSAPYARLGLREYGR